MILDITLPSHLARQLPYTHASTMTSALVLPANLTLSLCGFAIGLFLMGCYWLFQTMQAIPENHDFTGESGGYNLNAERRKRDRKAKMCLFTRSEISDDAVVIAEHADVSFLFKPSILDLPALSDSLQAIVTVLTN
ncbi:hypothetical protein DFH28DRAFT_1128945 [Melampsora americana]|nr:hypothetical protein DFH28DRAFT_1128945 [Melampsora americana]